MEQKWSLRPATEEDLENVSRIEAKVHPAPWGIQHFRSELTKPYSQFLLMTDDATDQEVAGYIVGWFLFDECQILNVAVSLPFRGLGFAKAMIRKLVTLAVNKNLRKVSLEVRKSNLPAIQLYQSMGFVIVQIRKSFYSNGEDAYFMTLSLEPSDPIRF
ncbi:MAG: ribosomal protein S18-alanine N-acetyltransferase [Bdellovibrio sp.]|nr:ribosomal protein S18-alanine N-acetyltransferase [Bdellovibrio sp.]